MHYMTVVLNKTISTSICIPGVRHSIQNLLHLFPYVNVETNRSIYFSLCKMKVCVGHLETRPSMASLAVQEQTETTPCTSQVGCSQPALAYLPHIFPWIGLYVLYNSTKTLHKYRIQYGCRITL